VLLLLLLLLLLLPGGTLQHSNISLLALQHISCQATMQTTTVCLQGEPPAAFKLSERSLPAAPPPLSLAGSVASITGGLLASGPDAAALNDNQTFLMYVSPELRRRYESTLLTQVEQVGHQLNTHKSTTARISDKNGLIWPCCGAVHCWAHC
jgi:hypothetical protein